MSSAGALCALCPISCAWLGAQTQEQLSEEGRREQSQPRLQSEPARGEVQQLEPNLSRACSGLGSLLGPAVCALLLP